MNKIIIKILSWLLHHANRNCKDNIFYSIKNKILKKYGTFLYYDVQFIKGKRCWCGDGIYDYTWDMEPIECYKCGGTSWYKIPVYNILEKIQFGKYYFHSPFKKSYKKPAEYMNLYPGSVIEGYIEHNLSKYGNFALNCLYLLFDFKGYLKRWSTNIGTGWRLKWYLPKNYVNNLFHLIKKRQKSFPIVDLKNRINKTGKYRKPQLYKNISIDDLPF